MAQPSFLTDARATVLLKSGAMPAGYGDSVVKGYQFADAVDYDSLLKSYKNCGFQATNFGLAVDEINKMIEARNSLESNEHFKFPAERHKTGCTIFLGYTSNMISSGMREIIRYLVEHNMIDCIVTTGGGIEEDFIKCLAPTVRGDFQLSGAELRKRGVNRIGNLLIANDNYRLFDEWVSPLLNEMLNEQIQNGTKWTPCTTIWRLGQAINNPESVYYWAWKNRIPVFCPAITDGSLGDMIYFHSHERPGLVIDIVEDLRRINTMAIESIKTGMIILGGALVKHHICNANCMRNGADYAVFINTAQEFDGSDSGARPDEAVSWGKIKSTASPVKIYSEATLVFPLLVAQTFAKDHQQRSQGLNGHIAAF